jgi:long-chain acyl-CoA synthetase
LDAAAAVYPNNPAIDFMGRTTTYAALKNQVDRAAAVLAARGVTKGTVVAIALPNCPQHVVAFFALMRLGAVAVEHNPTYGPEQFAEQLMDCGASHAIIWDKVALIAQAALPEGALDVIAVPLPAALPARLRWALQLPIPKARRLKKEMTAGRRRQLPQWDRLIRSAQPISADIPEPHTEDIALFQYTGGTTGTPKGAVLTHANLLANGTQSIAWVPGLRPGEEVFYGALPFFHAFGLMLCITAPVRLGALTVLFPKFDVNLILAAQRRRPGTFFPGVPPMFDRLVTAATADAAHPADLTSFRHAISGAMSLPGEVAKRWEEATGAWLIEGYGLTETSPIVLGNPISEARQPGTLGVPFPSTEARIADLDHPELDAPEGGRGELWVRGPQVFSGYWRKPEETAQCLTADGWFRTGDVVERTPDGFFRLVDRIKEVIITGGFNVYPSQVEEHLARMPQVAEVAVIGVPHPSLGERVVAAVVLADGAKLTLEQARAWCKDRISRYAMPKQLVLLTELPRSQVGKVLRRAVRHQVLGSKQAAI